MPVSHICVFYIVSSASMHAKFRKTRETLVGVLTPPTCEFPRTLWKEKSEIRKTAVSVFAIECVLNSARTSEIIEPGTLVDFQNFQFRNSNTNIYNSMNCRIQRTIFAAIKFRTLANRGGNHTNVASIFRKYFNFSFSLFVLFCVLINLKLYSPLKELEMFKIQFKLIPSLFNEKDDLRNFYFIEIISLTQMTLLYPMW